MDWFFLALLAAVIFAWVTIMDKVMVDRNFTDPFMYSLFIYVWGFISASIFVMSAGGWQLLSWPTIGAGLLAGVLIVGATSLYFVSLTQGDASLVSAVAQSRPLLALVWGFLILNEYLQWVGYLGIAIVVIATTLLSLERDELNQAKLSLNRIVPLMLLSNVFHSLSRLALKVTLREATPENAYFWEVVGALLTATVTLLVWPTGRTRMGAMLRQARARAFAGSAFNEFCASLAGLILTIALTTGTLAEVTTLYATQPLFIAPFIWLAARLRPGLVANEDWSNTLVPRSAMIVLLLVGIYQLQL